MACLVCVLLLQYDWTVDTLADCRYILYIQHECLQQERSAAGAVCTIITSVMVFMAGHVGAGHPAVAVAVMLLLLLTPYAPTAAHKCAQQDDHQCACGLGVCGQHCLMWRGDCGRAAPWRSCFEYVSDWTRTLVLLALVFMQLVVGKALTGFIQSLNAQSAAGVLGSWLRGHKPTAAMQVVQVAWAAVCIGLLQPVTV